MTLITKQMGRFYTMLVLAGLVSTVVSCKKSDSATSVTGRWQETELHAYDDSAGVAVRDSTYLNNFSAGDYAQFNSNGTCNLGSAHTFFVDGTGYPTTPQAITPVVSTINYSGSGSAYILQSQTGINFGGITIGDTVSVIGPNKLLIHNVTHFAFPGYGQVSDAYYERSNNY